MPTDKNTIRLLVKSIVNRLENQKSILFPAELRREITEEIFQRVGVKVLTDEDLHEQTLARIGANAEALEDASASESAQYRAARSIIRKTFGDDELNGLYFQDSLKNIAKLVCEYLMESPKIEDVFDSDEDLEKKIIESVKRFNPAHVH